MTPAMAVSQPTSAVADETSDLLLDVQDLRTYFHVMDGTVRAVDGVSFSIKRGETLGIVGESGCGKSVTALTIMRLLDIPPAEIASGRVVFDGRDILSMPENQMRHLRGNDIAMIFQEPMTSLNPVFTVGNQIAEAVRLHLRVSRREATDRAIESLRLVGINSPERRVKQYPHEMSGGMRQRVMIAMALSCEPKLLIADEPTTALDVTIQAQILELIRRIQADTGTALMLITHDLGVVAEMVHDVVVMYAGRVVEEGTVNEVLLQPRHPYTEGLLASIPSKGMRGTRLNVIKGTVPNPFNMPGGCNFAPRCPYRFEPCPEHDPRIDEGGGPPVACWLWKRAPGHDIPQEVQDQQVANARRAAAATTQAVSEAIPVEMVDGATS
jgi:oligopeptide/dipeptide ABC transporter ATP-binding protein